MDGSGLLAVDVQFLRPEGLDLRIVAEGLHKEVGGYLWGVEHIERLHHDHVHLAVFHRSTWGDIGIVAVLRGVGTGNQESLVLRGARLVFYLVGLGLVLQSLFQHVFHVGDRASLACLGELQRDKRIETHAAGAEEGLLVDDAIIEILNLRLVQYGDGFLHIQRQTEMAGQSVAGTAGDDAEGSVGVHQRASHLVHRAVATHGHDNIRAFIGILLGNLRSMAGIFREADLMVIEFGIECFFDEGRYLFLRVSA